MQYTFEYQHVQPELSEGWSRSHKRFDKLEDASIAAADWMVICFFNNWEITVRLIAIA